MAVLQIAQFTLEIFICPYHISFVVAMYALAVAKVLFRYGLNTPPPISFSEIATQGEDLGRDFLIDGWCISTFFFETF